MADTKELAKNPKKGLSIKSSETESSVFDENCLCILPEMAADGDTAQNANCPECLERSEICDWYFDCEGENPGEALNIIDGWASPEDDETVNAGSITTWISSSVSNVGAGKVRHLIVRGSQSRAEPTSIPGPKDSNYPGTATYTITLEVFPLCQKTYYGLRRMQKGGTFPMWYQTIGGGFYGGKCGIPTSIKNIDFPKEVGLDTYTKATVTLEFKAKCDPDRDFYDV